MPTIAQKLGVLLHTRKWTRYSLLGFVSDVSKSTIDNWLSGKTKPDIDSALKIARGFGVSLEYLADDSLDTPSKPSANLDEAYILRVIRDLNLSPDEAVRRLAGTVAEPNEDRKFIVTPANLFGA